MARCVAMFLDIVEDFLDRDATLIKDKKHGVLITVVQLITQVLIVDQNNK